MGRLTPTNSLRLLAALLGMESAWSLFAPGHDWAARLLVSVTLAVIAVGLLFRWRAFRAPGVIAFGLCAGLFVLAAIFNLALLLLPNMADLPGAPMESWLAIGAVVVTALLATANIGAALVLDGKQMKSVFRAS